MSDTPQKPSREEAEQLVAHAKRASDAALAGVSWRSATTLLALEATTSIGTLARNLSTGRAYSAITIVMIACATSELKGNVLIVCLASALIAIVTLSGAAREARS